MIGPRRAGLARLSCRTSGPRAPRGLPSGPLVQAASPLGPACRSARSKATMRAIRRASPAPKGRSMRASPHPNLQLGRAGDWAFILTVAAGYVSTLFIRPFPYSPAGFITLLALGALYLLLVTAEHSR